MCCASFDLCEEITRVYFLVQPVLILQRNITSYDNLATQKKKKGIYPFFYPSFMQAIMLYPRSCTWCSCYSQRFFLLLRWCWFLMSSLVERHIRSSSSFVVALEDR